MNIISLPASRGTKWISSAYRDFFKKNPLLWIGFCLTGLILLLACAAVPLVGPIASNLIQPVLLVGIMHACREAEKGAPVRFEMLFAGFSHRLSELISIGVLNLLFSIAALGFSFVVGVLGYASKFTAIKDGTLLANPSELLTTVLSFSLVLTLAATVFTILAMAFWFAPLLVYFDGLRPLAAVKQSLLGCLRNIWPFTLFGLAAIGWSILAVIPLGLGLFVLIPVMTIVDYTSYREIFSPSAKPESANPPVPV